MKKSSFCCLCTSAKWRCQQLYFLHTATSWKLQPKQVCGDRPFSPAIFIRILQYLHLICFLFMLPFKFPLSTLNVPKDKCLQWWIGFDSSPSLCFSDQGHSFNWAETTWTNFQKTEVSSSIVCHLGICFLQAKKASTIVIPNNSNCMRVCHVFVFQTLAKCKVPCLKLLCLST